jgi:epoxyqueuosine reductase
MFLRNVCVALGNSGDLAAVPALVEALRHPDELVRGHAAWALGEVGAVSSILALEYAHYAETADWVRAEMLLSLQRFGVAD